MPNSNQKKLIIISILIALTWASITQEFTESAMSFFENWKNLQESFVQRYEGMKSSRKMIEKDDDQMIYLGQTTDPDPFCPKSANDPNFCNVTGPILLYKNTTYTTNKTMIFKNAEIICNTFSSPVQSCQVIIIMTGSNTQMIFDDSYILGLGIVIQASGSQISLDDNSTLSARGQSYYVYGTSSSQGASFVSEGGHCGIYSNLVYGSYKTVPSSNPAVISQLIGSSGMQHNAQTLGGGRVIILADSIVMKGSGTRINVDGIANGGQSTAQNGGTGGYIYIKTYNYYNSNSIDSQSLITANGAMGLFGGFGGSGGVIIFDNFNPLSSQVQAYGGTSAQQTLCAVGGSGTIYYLQQDLLILNNGKALTAAAFQLYENQAGTYLSNIIIQGNALVKTFTSNLFVFQNFTIQDQSAFTIGDSQDTVTFQVTNYFVKGTSAILDLYSHVQNTVIQITAIGSEYYMKGNQFNRTQYISADTIYVLGNINPKDNTRTDTSLQIVANTLLSISDNVIIQAILIQLNSTSDINIGQNTTITAIVPSTTSLPGPNIYNNTLRINATNGLLNMNGTTLSAPQGLFLSSGQQMTINNSQITALQRTSASESFIFINSNLDLTTTNTNNFQATRIGMQIKGQANFQGLTNIKAVTSLTTTISQILEYNSILIQCSGNLSFTSSTLFGQRGITLQGKYLTFLDTQVNGSSNSAQNDVYIQASKYFQFTSSQVYGPSITLSGYGMNLYDSTIKIQIGQQQNTINNYEQYSLAQTPQEILLQDSYLLKLNPQDYYNQALILCQTQMQSQNNGILIQTFGQLTMVDTAILNYNNLIICDYQAQLSNYTITSSISNSTVYFITQETFSSTSTTDSQPVVSAGNIYIYSSGDIYLSSTNLYANVGTIATTSNSFQLASVGTTTISNVILNTANAALLYAEQIISISSSIFNIQSINKAGLDLQISSQFNQIQLLNSNQFSGQAGFRLIAGDQIEIDMGNYNWPYSPITVQQTGSIGDLIISDTVLQSTHFIASNNGSMSLTNVNATIVNSRPQLSTFDITFSLINQFTLQGSNITAISGTYICGTDITISNSTMLTQQNSVTNISIQATDNITINEASSLQSAAINLTAQNSLLFNSASISTYPTQISLQPFYLISSDLPTNLNLTLNAISGIVNISLSSIYENVGYGIQSSKIYLINSTLNAGQYAEGTFIVIIATSTITVTSSNILASAIYMKGTDSLVMSGTCSIIQSSLPALTSSEIQLKNSQENVQQFASYDSNQFPVQFYSNNMVSLQGVSIYCEVGVYMQSYISILNFVTVQGITTQDQSTIFISKNSYYFSLTQSSIITDQVFISALNLINIGANSIIQASDLALQWAAFTALQQSLWDNTYQSCNSTPQTAYSIQFQTNGSYSIRNSNLIAPLGFYECGSSYQISNASFIVATKSNIGGNLIMSLITDFSMQSNSLIIAGLFQLTSSQPILITDSNITQVLTYNGVAAGPIKLTSSSSINLTNTIINGVSSVNITTQSLSANNATIFTDPIQGALSDVQIFSFDEIDISANSIIDAEYIFMTAPNSIYITDSQLLSDKSVSPIQNSITLDSEGPISLSSVTCEGEQGILFVAQSLSLWNTILNATDFDGYHYDINIASQSSGSIQNSQIIGDDINIMAPHSLSIIQTTIASFKPQQVQQSPSDYSSSLRQSQEFDSQFNNLQDKIDQDQDGSVYIQKHVLKFKEIMKNKRNLQNKEQLHTNLMQINDFKTQADLLSANIPGYCIHIGTLSGDLQITSTSITGPTGIGIFGNTISLLQSPIIAQFNGGNLMLISQTKLYLSQTSIRAAKSLLYGPTSLILAQGSGISSTIQNTCNTDTTGYSDLFSCVSKGANYNTLSMEQVIQNYNSQFGTQIVNDYDMFSTLMTNFTVYLLSYAQMTIGSSNYQVPRFGMCASNITLIRANISATGRGCVSDTGIGKGQLVTGCAGSGASHGGMGGFGASDSNDAAGIMNCASAVSGPYTSAGDECKYEGSGGASGASGTNQGGNGGGLVWVSASQNFNISLSIIEANGQDGYLPSNSNQVHGSGGGSGGSIQVIAEVLAGNGMLQAMGGDGSINGGGGGAGGKLLVNYLRNYMNDTVAVHTYDWIGTISIDGGLAGTALSSQSIAQNGQSGTVWHPKCLPGYSGALCNFCPVGTFKYGYSYGECLPCQNAPDNSFYTEKAWTNADCPYTCSEGYENVDMNPDCLNSFDLSLQRLGAEYEILVFASIFIILTLLMWMCMMYQSSKKIRRTNKNKVKIFLEFEQEQYDNLRTGSRTASIQQDRESIEHQQRQARLSENDNQRKSRLLRKSMLATDIEMKDQFLLYHKYRMYFIGDNSISYPWYIPEDFPEKLFKEEEQSKIDDIIDNKQHVFQWSGMQKTLYILLRIFYPPFAPVYHRKVREQHYNQFKNLMKESFDESFWNDNVGNTSMRVYCSKNDFTLSHIDFLDYYKSFDTFSGPTVPLTILITGAGTFNSPYHLNYRDDPYSKQLILFHKQYLKEKLPLYLDNLNAQLAKLSFLSFTGQILKDLDAIVEWIEYGNEQMFHPLGIKCTLFIFENTYRTDDNSLQKRRSFPLDCLLFNSFPQAFKKLIRFLKYKKFSGKSELKLGLVFQKQNKEKQVKQFEKVQELVEKLKIDEMFEEEEKDNNQDENDKQLNQLNKNYSIQREDTQITDCLEEYLENSDSDDEGTLNKKEELMVNSKKQPVVVQIKEEKEKYKLSKAYSISKQSVEALEKALNKERRSCYHQWEHICAGIYSLYLLLLKNKMKPPREYQYVVFLFYASFIAIEILILFNFLVHLFYPSTNFSTFGLPFLLIYPLIPLIAPVIGVIGCCNGKPQTIQTYLEFNAIQFLFNLPLTLIAQIIVGDQPYYIFLVCWLILNKIAIAFFASMVRAHFENPQFAKNEKELDIVFGIEPKSENDEKKNNRSRNSSLQKKENNSAVKIEDSEEKLDAPENKKHGSHIEEEFKDDVDQSTKRSNNPSQVLNSDQSLTQPWLKSEIDS